MKNPHATTISSMLAVIKRKNDKLVLTIDAVKLTTLAGQLVLAEGESVRLEALRKSFADRFGQTIILEYVDIVEYMNLTNKLVQTVLSLNPNCDSIGAGMLAHMQEISNQLND